MDALDRAARSRVSRPEGDSRTSPLLSPSHAINPKQEAIDSRRRREAPCLKGSEQLRLFACASLARRAASERPRTVAKPGLAPRRCSHSWRPSGWGECRTGQRSSSLHGPSLPPSLQRVASFCPMWTGDSRRLWIARRRSYQATVVHWPPRRRSTKRWPVLSRPLLRCRLGR